MVFSNYQTQLDLSGDRFRVRYQILGNSPEDIRDKAMGICLEQTVELPESVVPPGDVRDLIVGQIEHIDYAEMTNAAEVTISYAVESAGTGLTQLLNVIFGNTSLQPGIQVTSLDLPDSILADYPGPRYGVPGLRKLLGVHDRPLVATALKPMGLSPQGLADLAYQIALGGLDIIKDDHGLANQPFCPFDERVERCAEAVARANQETGRNCIYVPNVTAPIDELQDRAHLAKKLGAGGVMVSFGLTGMDGLRVLAADDALGLPIISHPALSGSFITSFHNGMNHYTLYGQLMRLVGADAVIFVSFGGRFAYTEAQCRGLMDGCTVPMGDMPAIFPMPGGGMTLERLPMLIDFYGNDTILLVAGGLYGYSPDLVANTRTFVERTLEIASQPK